jgi:outer membrane protein OmpA-like peptidoglycan-associated protein
MNASARKIVGLGLGVAGIVLLGPARASAQQSCPTAQGESCWQAKAACEQRRAEAAAQKASALQQQLKDVPPVVRDTVLFKTDSAKPVEGAAELPGLAQEVKRVPDARVRIEGYTDSRGTQDYNHALSLRRAESVKAELVAQGVDKDKIDTVPMGEGNPQASNATVEGRAMNRRAEIIIKTGAQAAVHEELGNPVGTQQPTSSGESVTPSSQPPIQQPFQGQPPADQPVSP